MTTAHRSFPAVNATGDPRVIRTWMEANGLHYWRIDRPDGVVCVPPGWRGHSSATAARRSARRCLARLAQ